MMIIFEATVSILKHGFERVTATLEELFLHVSWPLG